MKNRFTYLILTLYLFSCQKEDYVVFDLKSTGEEISRIELRADHKTLLPNGVAKMEFYTFVYGKKKVISYHRDENKDNEYVTDTTEMEYLIPNDQLPPNFVKVYDPSDKELKDRIYSTIEEEPDTVLEFYAKSGNVVSNTLSVAVREIPDESYEELVVPIVFHMLIPPTSGGPSYDISKEYLQKTIQQMNDIFNRRITTDPNGGNMKITFKLAEYNNAGVKLQENGKHIIKLSTSDKNWIDRTAEDEGLAMAYRMYIIEDWQTCLWDPARYLNVWLTKFSNSSSDFGTYSYKLLAPADMHTSYDPKSIPGLKVSKLVDQFGYKEVDDCLEVGVLVNYNAFLNPQTQGNNEFSFATVLGGYYGLLETNCNDYSLLNKDGDNDYCADTYSYYYDFYPSVFKANNLDNQPDNDPARPMEWFTSFGVMDRYSRKNSVSVDQVLRMRQVLEQCPSRWNYKSKWAFNGKMD